MAYAIGSSSVGSATGTKFINLRVRRVRDAASALFNQSHFTRLEAIEVVDGDTSIMLDSVLVDTTRFPMAFVVGSGKIRVRRAWLYPELGRPKKLYVYASGVRIAALDVSGYSGTFNAIVGISIDGDSEQTNSASPAIAKPARARGARIVRLPESSQQAPVSNQQDVVAFFSGGTSVGTMDVDRQMSLCALQVSANDPPGGAPVDNLPGPVGEFPQARPVIITQADNAGTQRTRARAIVVDGSVDGANWARIVDTVDRRVSKYGVNNSEVYGSRLIEVMGGRIYLGAPSKNRRMFYASALKANGSGLEPHLNFNLSDTSLLPEERPNGGVNPRVGAPPDEIVLMRALSNRRLFMGGSRSCSILDDDPGFGGQVREASKSLGVLGPEAAAFDGSNNLYVMTPEGMAVVASGSGTLEKVSGDRIGDLIDNIDVDTNRISMGYRADEGTIHIAVTPRGGLTASLVVVFDTKLNAFWRDVYPIPYGPTVMLSSGGRSPLSRNLLLCGLDGGIRRYIPGRDLDETTPIDSYVRTAPFEPAEGVDRMMVERMHVLGTTATGSVGWELRVDESCEEVAKQLLSSAARRSGTLFVDRKGAQRGIGLRQRGAAHQVVIRRGTGGGKWEYSRIVVVVSDTNRRRKP